MSKIKIAVVGLGHLGSRHLKVYLNGLKDRVEITGICDVDPQKLRPLVEEYNLPSFDRYQNLVGQVDAVAICTPTFSHHEIAKFFLTQKIHTFVEKPMTMNLPEADELIAAAQKNNVKLQVGHVERFNSAFQAIKEIAASPLFIECHRLNHFPNRSLDIGAVMDLMIHDIDIILGLVQTSPSDIQAIGVKVLTEQEDIANARLTFQSGCVANLTASRVSEEVMRKIRIFLKETYISLDYVKQEAFVYTKDGSIISKKALPIEKEEPLKKELVSFVRCIQDNQQPIVSGVEGRQALDVALKILQKIWKK